MQKKIIALAVAAAFSAPAFADTTVYGIVDAAITNISKTGFKSRLDVTSGGLSTSRLGVKHTEGLDNGMTAVVVLEYGLDVANKTALGAASGTTYTPNARQQMLALAGDFGTVAAGFLQTTGYDFSGKFNPFAGSAVDPYSAANPTTFITTGSRAAHAAAYISPSMGGVTVAYNHAFNAGNESLTPDGSTTANPTTADLLSVTFDQGPLSVGGVYAGTADDDAAYAKVTEMGLGASYDFGVAKVNATYLSTKTDATGVAGNTDSMIGLSAVAPVGPGAVVFGYDKNTKDSTTAADNTSAYTLAYLQNLSKSVTAYGAIEKVSTETTTGSNVDTTVLAVGLRKKF